MYKSFFYGDIMSSRITERSLYPHLSSYLEKLKFNSLSELKSQSGQLDLLATKEGEKFIIEVKICKIGGEN